MDGVCAGCGEAKANVVFGMEWCARCALLAAEHMPGAPVLGLGYRIAVCALVQAVREEVHGQEEDLVYEAH